MLTLFLAFYSSLKGRMMYSYFMPVHNPEIAAMLYKLADLLEIRGENPFRIRAYRSAARLIDKLPKSVAEMLKEGEDLTELPGIGAALAEKIKTIVTTGKLPQLDRLEKKMPTALTELLMIEGLGPKRIKILHEKLHIKNLDDLKKELDRGTIRDLHGFGEKTEKLIFIGLKSFTKGKRRMKLADAEKIAVPLLDYLKKAPDIKKVDIAGSFRRRKETVGDLDILAVATKGRKVVDYFTKFEEVLRVISHGTTRSTVFLRSGIQVDLRVVPEKSYGAAMHYFTGSKSHNITIRKMALKRNLKVNEYGVYKGNRQVAGKTEKEFYAFFNMPYIEPELRENRGELEAALKGQLPKLITLKDIRGDLHCHTNATDGKYSLEAMAEAAQTRGYRYMAITDHSKHLSVARGLDKKRLIEQIKMIDKLNGKLKGFTILKGIEVDILENGQLDLPDSILKELDLTVCSVHYKFNLSEKRQTERILRAMDNPYFNILGHPSGRLIGRRDPYSVNIERIIDAVKTNGCLLEINAQPNRLDLDDTHCKMAKDLGIKMVVSTDAHSINQLANIKFGIDTARRGWLEKKDVINTYPLTELKKLLRRK
ncbi:DNA polymerase/3'-5' exonuclease PolX [Coxiella burnetii]|uniref:DNA polymerase/3'-5' exonuclease PolX n=1 Tax=Coxiella burnetii TaxID=777 RepID=UPI000CCC2F13|nr:DNA polymerase/3'-5' exonuclease PolX [Coxiella burnetii]PNT89541.1 DNA polymerase/3'-5' exonuclease PolX [Coxiella burnetii]